MTTHSQPKTYDVFISHSSRDKAVANRLAEGLQAQGYEVWLDTREVLVGDNIVDEVYAGIADSKFMVVLLSNASCESQWVTEEFTSARMTEIENRQVVILPAKIEECKIPAPLNTKKYADFTKDWNFGFQEIVTAIKQHPKRQLNSPPTLASASIPNPPNFSDLDQWRKDLLPEIAAAGFAKGHPFKDALIGPINGNVVTIEKTQLMPIVDSAKVRFYNWGALPFPYDKFPTAKEVRLQDGLRYVDTHPWPYRSQSFHFWQIDSRLRFLQRTYIDEDFQQSRSGNFYLPESLATCWALQDIIIPMMFARNILNQETGLSSLGVKLIWNGLKNRKLQEINLKRIGFFVNYQCQEPEWSFEVEITPATDIPAEALKAALDLFWLFGWDPQPDALEQIKRDLESLANGVLPD